MTELNYIKHYKLTPELRIELAQPQGLLFKGPPEVSLPSAHNWMLIMGLSIEGKKNHKIICVGDVVAKSFLEHPVLYRYVQICFIDGNTQRGENIEIDLSKVKASGKTIKEYELINPREQITRESFYFVKEKCKKDNLSIIRVKGEEDLLVLPATLESKDAFIFYGQPPITALEPPIEPGCVGIYSDEETKKKFLTVLDKFEILQK